jgi:diguanylate cyclase (GGDEF)-like protein
VFELAKLFAPPAPLAHQPAAAPVAWGVRARPDDLTGLLNHGTFWEWLEQSVETGAPFSVVLLDLDGFRTVNNAEGHRAGDLVLRGIADALIVAGRDTDHVFRYGGDEFCILLPGADAAGARRVADRSLEAVATAPAGRRHVTASVGHASFPNDGSGAVDILLAADRAAYVAKRRGGNQVASADEGLSLAGELRLQDPTPVDSPTAEAS